MRWSDCDFIVASPDFEGIPFIKRGRLMLPLRERGVSYDFLCYTPAEFEAPRSEPTIVRDAIEHEGEGRRRAVFCFAGRWSGIAWPTAAGCGSTQATFPGAERR